MLKTYRYALAVISAALLNNAAYAQAAKAPEPLETKVQLLQLAPPLNERNIEVSGLTWCGDQLIVLPQYPERLNRAKHSLLYAVSKRRIIDYVNGADTKPIAGKPIRLFENDIREKMTFFDGFEAIACDGSTLWFSIEAQNLFGTFQAYIVPAELDLSAPEPNISMRSDQIRYVKSQSGMNNKGDEAILIVEDQLLSLHEVNDSRVVSAPKANRVHTETGEQSQINFPNLPFRLTDATALDHAKRFWVINYKYSGDRFSRSADDPIADQYGLGLSHKKYFNLERLLEYQVVEDRIERTNSEPLQLLMEAKEGRNWEGLVRLDDQGFLLMTDKHPETLLGFVPFTVN